MDSSSCRIYLIQRINPTYSIHWELASLISQPGQAVSLFRRALDIEKQRGNQRDIYVDLGNLSDNLYRSGALHAAEVAGRHALLIAQELKNQPLECDSFAELGRKLAARGRKLQSEIALNRALALVHLHEKEYLNYSDLSVH